MSSSSSLLLSQWRGLGITKKSNHWKWGDKWKITPPRVGREGEWKISSTQLRRPLFSHVVHGLTWSCLLVLAGSDRGALEGNERLKVSVPRGMNGGTKWRRWKHSGAIIDDNGLRINYATIIQGCQFWRCVFISKIFEIGWRHFAPQIFLRHLIVCRDF